MSLTWSPLPPLTWFCPVIGHTGISFSHGKICDFAGPYFVSTSGFMAFGPPTRYIPLTCDPSTWDEGVHHANRVYSTRMHNICCDNCHSHVCCALNRIKYKGFGHWNMVILAFYMFFFGRFQNFGDFVKTFGPFSVIFAIFCYFKLQ